MSKIKVSTIQNPSSGTDDLNIDINGNVGIGTTSPSQLLEVAGSVGNIQLASSGAEITFTRSGPSAITASDASGSLLFQTGGINERARIDSSGRLLVGTSSTSKTVRSVFQGNSSGAADEPAVAIFAANTATPTGGLGLLRFSDNAHGYSAEIGGYRDGGTWTSGSSQPSRLVFSTTSDGASSPTERMRITSGGAALFNRTSESFLGSPFVQVGIENTNGSYFPLAIRGNTNAIIFNQSTNTASAVGSITMSASSTSYNTSSDYRLKENVVNIVDGISRVKQLQPKRFNFIVDPNKTVDGFIAHEAQTVVPEAVTGEKDGERMQGMDQSKLVPLLTAALQEAIAKIETLEQRLTDAGL